MINITRSGVRNRCAADQRVPTDRPADRLGERRADNVGAAGQVAVVEAAPVSGKRLRRFHSPVIVIATGPSVGELTGPQRAESSNVTGANGMAHRSVRPCQVTAAAAPAAGLARRDPWWRRPRDRRSAGRTGS